MADQAGGRPGSDGGGDGGGGDGAASGPGAPAPAAFGTLAQDAPITRADFERALRHLNLADLELRDTILKIGAQLVALTDELVRRVDKVEPQPAPPGTPAPEPDGTVEVAVARTLGRNIVMVRAGDERVPGRVALDLGGDKYAEQGPDIPCAELVHLCQARCCSFSFALSTQDLDEGVIRFDYGQPYLIRQRQSDLFCVHHDPTSRGCTVHAYRPRVCRVYDCREDERVWIDWEKKIPAPPVEPGVREVEVDLFARAKARYEAVVKESTSVRDAFADPGPVAGPPADATLRPTKKR